LRSQYRRSKYRHPKQRRKSIAAEYVQNGATLLAPNFFGSVLDTVPRR
jgi:hypothetical protein